MSRLNGQKALLLNQVRSKEPNNDIRQLRSLIAHYEDLEAEDFRGVISDAMYDELTADPEELQLWNDIKLRAESTIATANSTMYGGDTLTAQQDIQAIQRLISTYRIQFPRGKHVDDINKIDAELQSKQSILIEFDEWTHLDKKNYNKLLTYKGKYPNSVHLNEIDELMWKCVTVPISVSGLRRYLADWPMGKHAQEAEKILGDMEEWGKIKHERDIFKVKQFLDNLTDNPLKNEVSSFYYTLRDEHLQAMKACPSDFTYDDVYKYFSLDIFTEWELIDEGLIKEGHIPDRTLLPDIQKLQREDPNIQAQTDCTDIYLFGIPGTGKTCLLMGLVGADGQGYSINYKIGGGSYASALQQYVKEGITPGHTFGTFVTTITGSVQEEVRNTVIDHKINLIEMSGEEFALRIADNEEVTLSDMGTGATNLLQNDNRKVFFIIVDATRTRVKVEYLEDVTDSEGNIIEQRIRTKYVSQLDILNKFVSLFQLPENQNIMDKVDAIHFVVTKADTLGDGEERIEKARELLLSTYKSPVTNLKNYCRRMQRINYSTNYKTQVFTFSLGKFYIGDVFDFDDDETLKIVDIIRVITTAVKEPTWLDKLKAWFN